METYISGHCSLRGRVLFVNASERRPEADAYTVEARAGDYDKWRAALLSGAQVTSTDYYIRDSHFGTGYAVKLPSERPLPPMEPAARNHSY